MYRFTEGFGYHLTEGHLWVGLFAQRTLSRSVSQSLEVGTITISLHRSSENYKDDKVAQLAEPPLRPPKQSVGLYCVWSMYNMPARI